MTATCFICARRAAYTDAASGETLCGLHYMPRVRARVRANGAWTMLDNVQAWHAGSAYERDVEMSKRLARLVR